MKTLLSMESEPEKEFSGGWSIKTHYLINGEEIIAVKKFPDYNEAVLYINFYHLIIKDHAKKE